MAFTAFQLLPFDIRMRIWEVACRSARMSVISLEFDTRFRANSNSFPVYRMIQQPGCSSIAMACREAYSEWERTTILISEDSTVRTCMPRTIFILSGLAGGRLNSFGRSFTCQGVVASIQHIAFLVTQGVNLLNVLSSLSNLASLKTISIMLPGCDAKGVENMNLLETRSIGQYSTVLTDHSSLEAGRHDPNPLGLFLESGPPDPEVEAFYNSADAPQINVIIPHCDENCQHGKANGRPSLGFALFEYT